MNDERLIELLLDRSPEARQEIKRLRRTDAAAAAEIRQLEAFLSDARDALAPAGRPEPEAERALIERVLAATTREDLSWRGDVRLLLAFVRERMRASRPVRAVAAALFVNLTVLPVASVAWMLVRDPEPEPTVVLKIQPPAEPAFAEVEEEPVPAAAPEDLLDPAALEAHAVENRLGRARWLLDPAHGAVPAPFDPPAAESAPALLRLCDLKTRYLHGEPWSPWLDAPRWTRADDAELALYVDLCLDRFARDRERAPRLSEALARLSASVQRGSGGEAAAFQRETLDRAILYGLLDGRPERERRDPVDDAWRAALKQALGGLAADPRARGWVSGS